MSASAFRILMTADAVGGVWQYSVDLCAALSARGAEVVLAVLGLPPSPEQRRQIAAIPNVTLEQRTFALEWMLGSDNEVEASGRWLLDLQSKYHADLVHVNGYAHAALAWDVPVVCVAHSCVSSWWRAVHNSAPPSEWNGYRERVLAGLANSAAVIAPSHAMARALSHEYGYPQEAVRVIHNFSNEPAASDGKQPFCMAAGRVWDEAKNLSFLAGIAGSAPWPIRIAGNARAPQGHSRWEDLGRLDLLGSMPHSDLMRKLRAASIFLHPALYEPFGLVVLEAARARCCLLLSDIDSLRELWDGCAQFLDPRDPEQWMFEITRLSGNRAERESLAQRALRRSMRYRESATADAYCSVYAALLKREAPAAKGAAA